MTNASQIKALVRSHADGDDTRFYAIAIQVAAQAARNGHGRFAQELRELVDNSKAQARAFETTKKQSPVPLMQPRGDLVGLLTVSYPKDRLSDMELDSGLKQRIERVLVEQRQRDRIRSYGLAPIRKLLFVGPPGTGKTLTAAVVSGELGLPLFTIRLEGIMTKFMGETAAKLRLVFDAIQSTRGVYLFDEFDAFGGDRGLTNDVGEIRRVLNSFLQFLEQDDSDSLILGATNNVGLLDRALFRRFDAVLEYQLPSHGLAVRLMRSRLSMMDTSGLDWNRAAKAADGLSHAEITHACEQAAKNAILASVDTVSEPDLILSLEERRAVHS